MAWPANRLENTSPASTAELSLCDAHALLPFTPHLATFICEPEPESLCRWNLNCFITRKK